MGIEFDLKGLKRYSYLWDICDEDENGEWLKYDDVVKLITDGFDPINHLQACRDCGHVGQNFQYIKDEMNGDGDVYCGECGSPRTGDVGEVVHTLALRVDELEALYERMPRGQDLGIEGAFAGNQPWGFEL